MVVQNRVPGFENKVNFADERNVCLGYDLTQRCCERAGWFLSTKVEQTDLFKYVNLNQDEDISSYHFDPTWFQRFHIDQLLGPIDSEATLLFEEEIRTGKMNDIDVCVFRCCATGLPDLYLHIFNSHNGYYSHGFHFVTNDGFLDDENQWNHKVELRGRL